MNESESPAQKTGDSPYALFRNRDFCLYLIGRFIGIFGLQMLSVAVDWEIYERTHSALALGFVGLSQMVAIVALTQIVQTTETTLGKDGKLAAPANAGAWWRS